MGRTPQTRDAEKGGGPEDSNLPPTGSPLGVRHNVLAGLFFQDYGCDRPVSPRRVRRSERVYSTPDDGLRSTAGWNRMTPEDYYRVLMLRNYLQTQPYPITLTPQHIAAALWLAEQALPQQHKDVTNESPEV